MYYASARQVDTEHSYVYCVNQPTLSRPISNQMTKVLSIRQPWASMIVRGLKRFEIRTWQTSYRGQLIIHASSATPTKAFAEEAFEEYPELGELMERVGISSLEGLRALPRSSIVGVVTLSDIFDAEQVQSKSTVDDATIMGGLDDDSYYWLLTNAIEIEPVSGVNGKLNLWELDEAVEKAVLKRVERGTPAAFKSSRSGRVLFDWSSVAFEEDEPEEDGDEDVPDENRLLTPSKELAAIVGERPLKRMDVVKKLWEYIHKHGLQDPIKKRTIHSDERLLKVMGKRKVDIFDMTSKLSKHLS